MTTDRETFLALVERHGAGALGMPRWLRDHGHDAGDVFQDVAVCVWKHLGERPRPRDDRAWLMTIAYRAYVGGRVDGENDFGDAIWQFDREMAQKVDHRLFSRSGAITLRLGSRATGSLKVEMFTECGELRRGATSRK